MVVLVGSLSLFATRVHLVASSPRLNSLASREGVFLFNNLLLTVFAFVVLIGTLYPMFAEAITGSQLGVGRPFFDAHCQQQPERERDGQAIEEGAADPEL